MLPLQSGQKDPNGKQELDEGISKEQPKLFNEEMLTGK
ncbi:hypothetical protein ACVWYG_000742 [Pedobacter sp. UYEF25]